LSIIYLVDNDEDFRYFFRHAIDEQFSDIDIKDFKSGPEFLLFIESEEFQEAYKNREILSLVLDFEMPEMSGAELLQKIHTQHDINDLDMTIFSTLNDSRVREKVLNIGATNFIVKPTNIDEYHRTVFNFVNQLIEKKQSDRSNKVNILVMEDDIDFAYLIEENLISKLKENLNIKLIHNFNDLDYSKLEDLDIILSDLNLPDVSADELLNVFNLYAPSVPVVVITGENQTEIIINSMKKGVKDYLIKSNDILPILPYTVKKVIDSQNAHRQLEKEINDRKEMEFRSNVVKQTMVTLAHYINNSTTTISGYAQLCKMNMSDTTRFKKMIDLALKETKKITFVLQALEKLVEDKELKLRDYADYKNAMFDLEEDIKKRIENLN
jgi:DNA-binding NtrC family response regulator